MTETFIITAALLAVAATVERLRLTISRDGTLTRATMEQEGRKTREGLQAIVDEIDRTDGSRHDDDKQNQLYNTNTLRSVLFHLGGKKADDKPAPRGIRRAESKPERKEAAQ